MNDTDRKYRRMITILCGPPPPPYRAGCPTAAADQAKLSVWVRLENAF